MWPAGSLGRAATSQDPHDDAELDRHLTTVREQIGNKFLDLARRENLALEMAGTLDRAAQAATDALKRRHRWAQAVELLDKFLSDNLVPVRQRATKRNRRRRIRWHWRQVRLRLPVFSR